MAQNLRMLDCSNCRSKTEHLEYPPNHLLQLSLAVVAGVVGWFLAGHVAGAVVGFMGWVIYVWCSLIVFQKESECRVCGTPQKADKFAKRALVVVLCFPFAVALFLIGNESNDRGAPEYVARASDAVDKPELVDTGWEKIRSVGRVDMIYIEPGRIADEEVYSSLIGSVCSEKRFCKLMAWVDKASIPYSLPMLAEQEREMVMTYSRNTSTGHSEMLFSCRIISDPKRCF